MKLDLNLDYVVDDNTDRKNPAFETNSKLSITLMRTAINSVKNPERGGTKSRSEVRAMGKLVNTITKASNAGAASLDLDGTELLQLRDTLKSWMNDVGVPGSLTGWFDTLYEHVERVVDEMEKAKKPGSEVKP